MIQLVLYHPVSELLLPLQFRLELFPSVTSQSETDNVACLPVWLVL